MYSKTAFTCSGSPSSTVSSVTCGWPTGLIAQFADAVVEALRQQAVDHFLADLACETAAYDRLRDLAGPETGNLRVFPIVAGDVAEGLGYFFGGNVEHQFAGALRIQYRPC